MGSGITRFGAEGGLVAKRSTESLSAQLFLANIDLFVTSGEPCWGQNVLTLEAKSLFKIMQLLNKHLHFQRR